MSRPLVLFGFHAIGVRLKTAPGSVMELLVDEARRDGRMRQMLARAAETGTRVTQTDARRLDQVAGTSRHQGLVARVEAIPRSSSIDDTLDAVDGPPLLLVLDGVTDPHNLGACLRAADGAGAHAVIAPVDHAVGINATVAKVASGAAETVPYFMVTNLARTLGELKERDIRIVGASERGPAPIWSLELAGPLAIVMGAEGRGMRQLTEKTCDVLARVPMRGAVDSLNVSVASAICLYEAARQRMGAASDG